LFAALAKYVDAITPVVHFSVLAAWATVAFIDGRGGCSGLADIVLQAIQHLL
jgi:hypothetical protein